jgi:THO complex subunit 1
MQQTTHVDSPDFGKIWSLFDLLMFMGDAELCDPKLMPWLVEELLESQSIAGCRTIFDYLESRREDLIRLHFTSAKDLVILRMCNELLRRLSRAEDISFCGRVFIFIFQSFKLGERSTVNLRGEYHVENVTTYDEIAANGEVDTEKMDVDSATAEAAGVTDESKAASKNVSFQSKEPASDGPPNLNNLYPVFWSLQESFSQPKKLFDQANFAKFKKGMEATMAAFRSVKAEQGARPSKQVEDGKRTFQKRKRDDEDTQGLQDESTELDDQDMANAFNAKYLTSRDLFELEIHDLSFRRYILVQALIIMDFLLSLTPTAKLKLSTISQPNKSVTYPDEMLSEADTTWVTDMKKSIADYLKRGSDGPFFFRMVETVLSRDKNWVRWKAESCPSISKPALSSEEYKRAKEAAHKAATNKRLRPTPMGSLSLTFLADGEGDADAATTRYKDPERYELPAVADFKRKIEVDDLEIEMPKDNQSKAAAIESKASKSWRALRIASRSRLTVFDKIDNPDKIDVVFEDPATATNGAENGDAATAEQQSAEGVPSDLRPIVFAGPVDAGRAMAAKLLEKHPRAFSIVAAHTTRPAREGEKNGQDFFFVNAQAFNVMRDGDQLLEYTEKDGVSQGTNRKAIEAIKETGKVPLLLLSYDVSFSTC